MILWPTDCVGSKSTGDLEPQVMSLPHCEDKSADVCSLCLLTGCVDPSGQLTEELAGLPAA
jgi:hypothetical protein